MTGLALWWLEHPHVARKTLVCSVVSAMWNGLASPVDASRDT